MQEQRVLTTSPTCPFSFDNAELFGSCFVVLDDVLAVVEGVVLGARGVVEGAAGVVEGARGVVEGAAGVVLGVVDGAAGVVEGAAGFLFAFWLVHSGLYNALQNACAGG